MKKIFIFIIAFIIIVYIANIFGIAITLSVIIFLLCISRIRATKINSSTNRGNFNSINKRIQLPKYDTYNYTNNREMRWFLIRKSIELGLFDKAIEYIMGCVFKKTKNIKTPIQNNYEAYSEVRNSNETKPCDNKIKDDNENKNEAKIDNENKLYNEIQYNKNINKKVGTAYLECLKRIKDIKNIIKDFDYSDKETYSEEILEIENDINKELKIIDNASINIVEINKIIDRINIIYRNAYNRKNNVSSLSYIIGDTDEDINLIDKIDIENLE